MLMYVGHLMSLCLYFATIITVIFGLMALTKVYLYGSIRWIVPVFLISLLLQSSSFIALQIDWIYADYNTLVGDATAYGWLAFDYFNGFAMLSFATATKIWLSWRVKKEYDPRCRRWSDGLKKGY